MFTAEHTPRRQFLPPPLLIGLGVIASVLAGLALASVDPVLGIAFVIMLGLAAVLLSRPEWATLIVLFLFYSNLIVIATRQGVPQQLAGGVLLALGYPLFHYLVLCRERVIITTPLVLMIVYLGTLLVSAAFSDDPTLTFDRIQDFVLEGLILFFLVINAVRTRALLRQAIWTLLLAGSMMGAVTVYQGVTQRYDNEFMGFAQVTEAEIGVGEEDFLGNKPVAKRLAGPIGEKNRYAQVLVVLLPLAVTRMLAERQRRWQVAGAVSGLIILGGIQFTFSRGAGVSVGVIFLTLILLRLVKIRYAALIMAVAIAVAMAVAPGYFYRLSTLEGATSLLSGDPSSADSSVQSRATENLATFLIFEDHPLLGVGPGQTSRFIRDYGRGVGYKLLDPSRRAHNMYLEEMADTGLVGFGAFMSIVGVILLYLFTIMRRTRRQDREAYLLAAGFFLGILAYLTTAVFLHLSYARYYWFLLAIASATVYILRDTSNTTVRSRR